MIADRLTAVLTTAPECLTAAKLATLLGLVESQVHELIVTGALPPLVEIGGTPAWTIKDLRVWLRRHEPLWDEGDADEPGWWPHGPAIERMEGDDFGAAAAHLSSIRYPGQRCASGAELNAKYGVAVRERLARIDGGRRV